MDMKLYIASSWRNQYYEEFLKVLEAHGHRFYDFKNPYPGGAGFHWREVGLDVDKYSKQDYLKALKHPTAERGFYNDLAGLDAAYGVILLLPCGKSAHLELGYAIGKRKKTMVFCPPTEPLQPELMYKWVDKIAVTPDEVYEELKGWKQEFETPKPRWFMV